MSFKKADKKDVANLSQNARKYSVLSNLEWGGGEDSISSSTSGVEERINSTHLITGCNSAHLRTIGTNSVTTSLISHT